MSNGFNIREIELFDVDIVFDHIYQLAHKDNVLSPDFVFTKERLINELFEVNADWYGLVVTYINRVIASCCYSFVNTNRPFNSTASIFIDILFVEYEFRGKDVGQMIMNKLIEMAQWKNLSRIELWCMQDNISAIRFYQRNGANKIDPLEVLCIKVPEATSSNQ